MTAAATNRTLPKHLPGAGRVVVIVALTVAWCALWREFSVANLLIGFVLATAISAAGIGSSGRNGVRFGPLLRLGWLVMTDLVTSTINVGREVLTRTDYTEEAIIAVDVDDDSAKHMLLLTVAITLTPGTAVVDVDNDEGIIFLHLLHYDRAEETVAHVRALSELACRALPTPTDKMDRLDRGEERP